MPETNTCILSYTSTEEVEKAIRKLQAEKFNLATVSIIGNGEQCEDDVVGIYTRGRNIHFHGKQEKFWEHLWQQFDGALLLVIPDIGVLVATGRIVPLLVKENEDIDIHGFSSLGVALYDMGVPVESISRYEQTVKAGNILLIVNARRIEVEHCCRILHSEIQQATVHLA